MTISLADIRRREEEEARRRKYNQESGYDLSKQEFSSRETSLAKQRDLRKKQAQKKFEAGREKAVKGEGMESELKAKDGESSFSDNAAKAAAAQQLLSQTGLDAKGTENAGMGAAGGAMSGALAGSAFGWQGALIGGTIGGISGGMQAKAAKKRRLAEIEANKFKALGEIELQKSDKINRALENLQRAFQTSLLSKDNLTLF